MTFEKTKALLEKNLESALEGGPTPEEREDNISYLVFLLNMIKEVDGPQNEKELQKKLLDIAASVIYKSEEGGLFMANYYLRAKNSPELASHVLVKNIDIDIYRVCVLNVCLFVANDNMVLTTALKEMYNINI